MSFEEDTSTKERSTIVLVGGGGHCEVVIDIIKEENLFDEILISDLPENLGKYILDVRIDYSKVNGITALWRGDLPENRREDNTNQNSVRHKNY